jgi:hypothetical protein
LCKLIDSNIANYFICELKGCKKVSFPGSPPHFLIKYWRFFSKFKFNDGSFAMEPELINVSGFKNS